MEDWFECNVLVDDLINVVGDHITSSNIIFNNSSKLYIILFPNIMLTGTNLSDSFSCLRRSVISTKIQRIEKEKGSSAMLQGTFIHEIFQKTLLDQKYNFDEKLSQLIKTNLIEIFATQDTEEQISDSVISSFPNMKKWFSEKRQNYSVLEIEDCISSKVYGLKGKIDGTFSMKSGNDQIILPFELKTGKITSNPSHRAQTLIYTILLSEKFKKEMKYGILYYLSSHEEIKIPSLHHEIRAILLKRNEFVRFLSRSNEFLTLPLPIDNELICARCFQADNCFKLQKVIIHIYILDNE